MASSDSPTRLWHRQIHPHGSCYGIRFTHTAHAMTSSDSPKRLWHHQIHPHGYNIIRFTHTAVVSSDSPTRLWHRQVHPRSCGIVRFTHTASASSDSPTRPAHRQIHPHGSGYGIIRYTNTTQVFAEDGWGILMAFRDRSAQQNGLPGGWCARGVARISRLLHGGLV